MCASNPSAKCLSSKEHCNVLSEITIEYQVWLFVATVELALWSGSQRCKPVRID